MKNLIVIILLIILLGSCTSTRYIEVPVDRIKIKYRDKTKIDTLIQKDKYDQQFIDYVTKVKNQYKNIKFVGGDRKKPWTNIIKLDSVPVVRCFEYFHGKYLKFPFPKHYAKKNNKTYRENITDNKYYMFDYINI